MKNASRNKFLLCFRPVVDMDELVLDSQAAVSGSKHHPFANEKQSSSENSSFILHSPRKTSFSRSVAVLFDIILAKRVHDGRGLYQDSLKSKLRGTSSSSSLNNSRKSSDNKSIKSNSMPLSSSSSSRSTSRSEQHNLSVSLSITNNNIPNPNQESEVKPRKINNSVIYFLLLSLIVTVFWGKVCAIIFTSIWIHFLPRHHILRPPERSRKLPEKNEGEKYKKRVIMEGLLQRNHHQSNRG